jgi:DNA polymerase-3 subunit beta
MKFTVERADFLRIAQKTQNIVERRMTLPILSYIFIEARDGALAVTANNLETGFSGTCPAKVDIPGTVTVSGKNLHEILQNAGTQEIAFTADGGTVSIKAGRASFKLNTLPAEDYPLLPKHEGMAVVPVPARDIGDMIGSAMVSVAPEEVRFNLSGVFMEKTEDGLRFVSTDGHRLSLVQRAFPGLEDLPLDKGVILPRKGVTELAKFSDEEGDLEFGCGGNSAVFRKGGSVLVMRLVEGVFPDYRRVLPTGSSRTLKAARETLLAALKRMGVLLSDRYRGVTLELSGQVLRISVENPEIGHAEEEVEVEYQGEPLKVGFNARYLADALQALKSRDVTVGFNDDVNPCQITGEEDPGVLHVVMPMRV